MKAKLIKAYFKGLISKVEFIDYLKIHPGVVITSDGKFQNDADEKKVEICNLIGFDLLVIDVYTIRLPIQT